MKILHVINSLETGGAQKLVSDLLLLMAEERDVEVGVLLLQDSGNSALYSRVKNSSSIRLYDLSEARHSKMTLVKAIRSHARDYDVIHAHLFPSGYLTVLATAGLGKPVYYTEHSTHNRRRDKRFLRPLERVVYSRYKGIVAISDPVARALSRWLKSQKLTRRITTIPNGVQLSGDFTLPKGGQSQLPLKEGQKAVLMISRFTPSKDQSTLIRALALTTHKELAAVFAGDGETLASNKKLAVELGVDDRCCFLGTRNDITALIQEAYIGVQASNWEGFGLSAIEMMAGGLPVIGSDVPGLGDVIRGAGILFPKNDAEALARELDNLAGNNEIYHSTAEKGLERAKQYDISSTVRKYMDLYKNTL